MTSVPAYPVAPRNDGGPDVSQSDGLRAYRAPYETLNFEMVTRGGRPLMVALEVQPVFDLERSTPVSRRVRRRVRRRGGEQALSAVARGTLESTDLKRLDLQTFQLGLELLRLGSEDTGVLPLFWRTAASSRGRLSLLSADRVKAAPKGALLVEVMGGLEQTPPATLRSVADLFERDALGVILHLAPDAGTIRRMAEVRPRCLSLDFAGVAHETGREWRAACDLIGEARASCPQVMLVNLRPDRGLAAQAAGATHAVFAGLEPITV